MGKNHPPEITRRLRTWHTIAEQEVLALSKGDFDELARLIDQSAALQTSLVADLAHMTPRSLDKESINLMQSIQKIQSALMAEMEKGCAILGDKIKTLHRNSTSLKGYKHQGTGPLPQFLNKRT